MLFGKGNQEGGMLRKTSILVTVMAVLLALALSYIAYDAYAELQLAERISIYQQGLQAGYEQAVAQLFQQAATCQQVPVFFNNQTINVIAVECLQPPVGE
jgi:hypothetical protein